ncbi:MAG: helix-turn-helix domain-containing protein [Pseudonocardia sp.]|nr:helix-turn-helix domain-containing protein [Pseudonocardia sp.]
MNEESPAFRRVSVNERTPRSALRSARIERGWSQARAAAELRALALRRGGPDASAASLKTQLSRWENGHAVPEPEYRALLAELYGRAPDELGLLPAREQEGPSGPERLRASLAAAAAADVGVVELWSEQLAVVRRLDDELGAAGAGGSVQALVDQLEHTLCHALTARRRAPVAEVLAEAAVLAGHQALDRGDPERAWRHHVTAGAAARQAPSPTAAARALAGQAAVLHDIGSNGAAVELLEQGDLGGSSSALVRLAAARGVAHAAAGDAPAAGRALDDAEHVLSSTRFDLVRRHDEPGIELADLHRWRGHALVTLRDPAAVTPLEDALAAGPRSVRHRAALHADLALALTDLGRGDEAFEHARTARQLATRIGSLRITARLSRSQL